MSRGSKLTDEERISALQDYRDGKGSYRTIGIKYGVSDYTMTPMEYYASYNA